MPSPNNIPELLEEWKKIKDSLIAEGFSRNKGHIQIAKKYKVSVPTVYRWLTPGFKEKERRYAKKYRTERLTKEMKRKYNRKYIHKPEVRKKLNQYQRKYLKLIRHLDTYIVDLFRERNEEEISLGDIAESIYKSFDINLKPETIINAVRKYNES